MLAVFLPRPPALLRPGGGAWLAALLHVLLVLRESMQHAATHRAQGLPLEVVFRVVWQLHMPAADGDATSIQTLVRLSAVSHVVRHWALHALYDTLYLPRHVRDFRKWYARMRAAKPPFPCVGYVRALFVGMDDITRLTQSSAGWEAELLRLLHYCGSTIEHLSLWQTESRALLRDAAQVSGSHARAAWAVGEHILDDTPEELERDESDDMPQWLRDELAQLPAEHVARQHMAHFPFVPRAPPKPPAWLARPKPRLCTPRFLSLVLYYPFFENERPELFARMVLWSRVEELDVYLSMEPRKSLHLLACLAHTPTWRLRVSSAHATLAIETQNAAWPNACGILAALLRHAHLEEALLNEMRGHGVANADLFENACFRELGYLRHVRLNLTQKNQAVWGKLRHRLWDFRERAQFRRQGAWSEVLRPT